MTDCDRPDCAARQVLKSLYAYADQHRDLEDQMGDLRGVLGLAAEAFLVGHFSALPAPVRFGRTDQFAKLLGLESPLPSAELQVGSPKSLFMRRLHRWL